MDLTAVVADELDAVRRRSLDLLAPLPDHDLTRQISPIMSPLVWDLAHVGNYEELWLLRAVTGTPPIDESLDSLYDAFRHPRKNRPSLPLLGPVEARRYIGDVRGRVLDTLEQAPVEDPLTRDGFVYGMVIQHEHQHDETMLATLQLMGDPAACPNAKHAYGPLGEPTPAATPLPAAEVFVPAGPFTMGTDEGWAYDNERPAHRRDLPGYWIDAAPVTNRQYLDFIDADGYCEPRWWSDEGWAWRQESAAEAPLFWREESQGSWSRLRFGWREDVPADEPVQHVSWFEAEAYARWAGKRLPTEAEWEKAAAGCSASVDQANLGQRRYGPAPVGAYPDGASAYGAHQLIGDVWEWTSSEFEPYPGFASYPYREYSEVFFGGGYKVLRGGSWATDPVAARPTFRNWDLAQRRQIFAGFRCARNGDS